MLNAICQIAQEAGDVILKHYGKEIPIDYKSDNSPLTQADQASHHFICDKLRALDPTIPVLSEESSEEEIAARKSWTRFWLVDPLDGTKEFIKQSGQFTVNIALIEGTEAVLGVIYVPVTRVSYFADKNDASYRQNDGEAAVEIKTRDANINQMAVVASRDHAGPQVEAILKRLPNVESKSMGSSLKFCMVAEGDADMYPRTVPTMEWDTAAAQCIVETAGGTLTDMAGERLTYNKDDLRNPSIMTVGDTDLDWKKIVDGIVDPV